MNVLCKLLAILIIVSFLVGCSSSAEDKARIAELEAELELQKQTTVLTSMPTTTASNPTPNFKRLEVEDISFPYDDNLFSHELHDNGTHYLYVRDGQSVMMIQVTDLGEDASGIEKEASLGVFDGVAGGFEESFKVVLYDPDDIQRMILDGRVSYTALFHLYDGSYPYNGDYSFLVTALYGDTSMHMISFLIDNDEWDDPIEVYSDMINEIKVIKTSTTKPITSPSTTKETTTQAKIKTTTTQTTTTQITNAKTSTTKTTQNTVSSSQQMAVKKAKEYLSVMAFSRLRLIDQLVYAKFSREDATYGVDNCGANWNDQVVRKAQEYVNLMAFSRLGLFDQLKGMDFTESEAIHGVNNCGANWNDQAVKKAQEYLSLMAFSREELINQLVYSKFTRDEATYGVDNCGVDW